jgi:hypothetical protein
MVAEPLVVEFHEDVRDAIVSRMVGLTVGPGGWINFSPGLDVDEPPPARSPLAGLFTGRGPDVPFGTWSPAGRRDPSSVGIQHGRGPKALTQLAEMGVEMPAGWRRLSDHAKHGLVVAVPSTSDPAELDATLDWLLRATGLLCPIRRTGEWRALCHIRN